MLLPIHIAAGGLAIVLGAVALLVKKGGTIHRRSGLLFVYAMLVMGTSASILALRNGVTDGNVMAALLTAYFVGTALTTVRPASPWTRRVNAAALTFALGLALIAVVGGVTAVNSPRVSAGGVPFRTIGVMSFVLATMLILAAIGDARVMRFGLPRGGPRLARHLWRMCFALFIASGSFFLGQMKFVPKPVRSLPLMFALGLAPLLVLLYWMWRVRLRRSLRGLIVGNGRDVAASPTAL